MYAEAKKPDKVARARVLTKRGDRAPSSLAVKQLRNGEYILYSHAIKKFASSYDGLMPIVLRLIDTLTQGAPDSLNNGLRCTVCGDTILIKDGLLQEASKHVDNHHRDIEVHGFTECELHQELLFNRAHMDTHNMCTVSLETPVFQYRGKIKTDARSKTSSTTGQPKLYYRFGRGLKDQFSINFHRQGFYAREILEMAYPGVFAEIARAKYNKGVITEHFGVPKVRAANAPRNGSVLKIWLSLDEAEAFAATIGIARLDGVREL
jgi:hypothetical protein